MMQLYWSPQSRSFRAVWMLEEAGAPYERVLVDIRAGAQAGPRYRAVNPMMKVPALADGDVVVSESGAICAYVADRVPEAALAPPVEDPERGPYYRWLFFAAGCIEPAYAQKAFRFEGPSHTLGWGSFERVVDVLAEALAEGPWVLGERFTAADVMLASDLYYGVSLFKIVEPRPAFTAYIERAAARPAFRRALAIDAEGAAARDAAAQAGSAGAG